MIELYCQHCGHALKIPDQYAGQTGTCKNCGKQILVPKEGFEPDPVSALTQKAKDIPYKWIGATVAVVAVLAIGAYAFLGKDSEAPPRPLASEVRPVPTEVPSTSPHSVTFPSDRVVGRLWMRDEGAPLFGQLLGDAGGSITVPAGRELGLWVQPGDPADLAFLLAFAPNDLGYLVLFNPLITNGQLRSIEHLTGLTALLVEYCDLTDAGLRSLERLVDLEFLGLGGTKITDKGLATLTHLHRLNGLSLGGTRITDRGIRSLKSLPLEIIMINGIALTGPMVDALKEFPGLTMLRIDSGRPPDVGRIPGGDRPTSLDSILLLGQITQLETLVLAGKLHDDSLIPALSQLTHLKKIEFQKTSVTPAARNELRRALPNCTITPQDAPISNIAENLSPPSPNFPDFTKGKKYVSLAVDTQSAFTLNPEDMSFTIGERREFFAGLGNIRESPGFSFAFETVDALDFRGETFHTLRFILRNSQTDFYAIMRDDGFYFYHYLDDDAPRFFIEYPLRPGMRWSHDVYRDGDGRGTPERQTVTQHYYADAEETIRTPAGTFTCIRVLMGDTPPLHDGPDVYANWYTKGFGGNVQVRLADGTVHIMKVVRKP